MQSIRTLIVDDEPLARENLKIRLAREADFEIVGECGDGRTAVTVVAEQHPDLMFIDVRMPGMDGFEAIAEIPPAQLPVIVFVTAHDRYALDAFRVHALDYLLKPIEDERFVETLRVCRERVAETWRAAADEEPLYQLSVGRESESRSWIEQPGVAATDAAATGEAGKGAALDRLVIKTRGRVFFLKTTSIDWVEANGDYSCLHVGAQDYLLRKTMHELEERLSPDRFVRISRSAIVNLDRVEELRPLTRGEFLVRLTDGQDVKLTRTYRDRLETMLGDRL